MKKPSSTSIQDMNHDEMIPVKERPDFGLHFCFFSDKNFHFIFQISNMIILKLMRNFVFL